VPYVNPLTEQADTDPEDLALVARVQTGSRQALETLLKRHQPWIYNILVRMLYYAQEAEYYFVRFSFRRL
jgi:DNA-directed RNA polymerase specialized sigma24 family protein